jgi:hypothetical protein
MKALRFLRKSWPIWALWVGTILFITGLAINPFWTFAIIWIGIIIAIAIMSIRASIMMNRED